MLVVDEDGKNYHKSYKSFYCHSQMKLWKGNLFASVCLEFCPQGVSRPSRGVSRPRGCPGSGPGWGVCIPAYTQEYIPKQTATAANGTHPTGMPSCFNYFLTF